MNTILKWNIVDHIYLLLTRLKEHKLKKLTRKVGQCWQDRRAQGRGADSHVKGPRQRGLTF